MATVFQLTTATQVLPTEVRYALNRGQSPTDIQHSHDNRLSSAVWNNFPKQTGNQPQFCVGREREFLGEIEQIGGSCWRYCA